MVIFFKLRLQILILFFGLASIENYSAQDNVVVKVHSLPSPNINCIFEYFYEEGWKNLTSKSFEQGDKISLNIKFEHTGQYRIRMASNPEHWGDFIVDISKGNSPALNIEVNYNDLKKQPIRIDTSKEHDAYSSLMIAYNSLSLNPDSLERNSLDYLKKEREFYSLCEKTRAEFPGTYTGDVLAKVLGAPIAPFWKFPAPSVDSLRAYNAKHGLDYLNLTNHDVFHHIGFVRKLNLHFNYFFEQKITEQYIDQVMVKALADDNATTFLFKFLLDKMIAYKDENGLSYLITWYSSDCAEGDLLNDATKNLLHALENCKPGNKVEMLTLPDINGRLIAMSDIVAKNKITLLLFWKSSCSHCKEFEPVLEGIYEKYHPLGVEVYAIGTDKQQEAWQSEMKIRTSAWPSVFLAFTARKDFSKRFPVPSTPTLIAVDQNGKILRRMIMRSKLESILDEMLTEIK